MTFSARPAPLRLLLVAVWLSAIGAARPASARQQPVTAPAAKPRIVPATAFPVKAASAPITIDGRLDDPGWANAAVIPLPYEYQPGDNIEPPVRTDCLVTFDERNLYVAFRAFDPRPADIRSHLMARDDMDTFIQDDHIGFLIDPFNDERRAFQFRANPAGVQADAINSEVDGSEDWSWDAIWQAAGRVGTDGYVVEIAIPFNQLRFPAGAAMQTWGFDPFRSYPRSVRHRITSHLTDRNKSCGLCQANKLTGFVGLRPGRNLELDPTLTMRRSDRRDVLPEGPVVQGPLHSDPGLSLRWSVTPNVIVSGAANPDFSQVEADVAQLDVNTRFALFYPEKRPFFLEGADFFSTPEQAVFTRTVADPAAGLKLTSKSGPNAFGVFVTRDRTNNLLMPSNQATEFAFADESVTGTVLRYRRDTGARSTLGALYAGREGAGYHNHVFGPDAFLRMSGSDTLRLQVLYSATEYPDSVVKNGTAPQRNVDGGDAYAEYQHLSRSWFWNLSYNDRARGFRADSGFIPRVDVRTTTGSIQRRFWGGATRAFTTIDVGAGASRTYDHDGTLTDQAVGPYVQYTGPQQSMLVVSIDGDKERFAGITYDLTRARITAGVKPGGALSLALNGQAGDAIDYANGQPARRLLLAPSIEYKIGDPLNLQFSHNFERLTVARGWLYTANLAQARIVYHFNVRTFARAILQYTNVTRDPSLFVAPIDGHTRHLFSQYLFSYKLNPQTVLLLGYSDTYEGLQAVRLAQSNRTFFVKVGYAWLL